MKKYTLAAAAVATLFVGSASAVDIDISGNIQEVCTASATTTALNTLSSGTVSGISFECNDRDGASISISSAEGGLQGIDSEDVVIPYIATLNVGSTPLVLDLSANGNTGLNDVSVEQEFDGEDLIGGLAASLDIVVTAAGAYNGAWAGSYYDQLTIQISAL